MLGELGGGAYYPISSTLGLVALLKGVIEYQFVNVILLHLRVPARDLCGYVGRRGEYTRGFAFGCGGLFSDQAMRRLLGCK